MSGIFSNQFWNFVDSLDRDLNQLQIAMLNAGFTRPKGVKNTKNPVDNNPAVITDSAKEKSLSEKGKSTLSKMYNNYVTTQIELGPPIDLLDRPEVYELHVSLAGAEKDQIHIDFDSDDNEIKIYGEIETHKEVEKENYKFQERRTGSFTRTVSLPIDEKLDEDKITSSYKNGVLTVFLPKLGKKEKKSVRKLEIS
ncbi:Hsp20/alpha crystallin family protein [Ascoidea rubescens DSM 1968]|uniref:HSP20-like chaperone n=1 Tax=Ascoidea rubescens DSM 1968 TaxID=1344418 RepID=A0A1D2VLI2_9ASCO|nr:HSP20-like chaperone [Ascoidea rubescens DSM 1968]ODV62444.1 HSP20-like chaperone [Ascoidea rubescens DSM 1968]